MLQVGLLESSLIQITALSGIVFLAIYIYFKLAYSYWEKRGIPTFRPRVPFGNFGDAIFSNENPSQHITKLYGAFEGHKVGGLYRFDKPSLLIRDPEIIKEILIKNFDHFYHRGVRVDVESEPLIGNLFSLNGTKWRNMRVQLSPTFTSGKMKMMFSTLVDCGMELKDCLLNSAQNGDSVEIKDILGRYSTDIIASCAFGVECNCLKNPEAEFRNWGRKVFSSSFTNRMFRLLILLYPSLIYKIGLTFIPKDVSSYFRKMVKETVEYREKNNVKRNDFMQLLIQLKNKTLCLSEEEEIKVDLGEEEDSKGRAPFDVTMDVVAAQAFVFFIAGFETSSTAMTFCLYELALNPDIQKKVRLEIDTVLQKHDGNITYESIFEMTYLDKVVSETLRKYPSLIILTRECTRDIKLQEIDLLIEKGMQVILPVMALHHDPKYFPDPERFDPERFSEDEKKKRPHFCYLPFGEGPRICIGMRFGLMQTKVGLISLLSNYEFQVSEKTPIPVIFDAKTLTLSPSGGLWLKIANRTDKT